MKKEVFSLELIYCQNEQELNADDQQLLQKAHEATVKAYAPYSRFRVGAALRLSNGHIIQGNNQENAAYPSGLCAERVALFYANALYPDAAVEAIAVTIRSERSIVEEPITPCGSCRQVMAEYEKKSGIPMRVIMQGERGQVMIAESMKVLLPFSFLNDYLLKYKP